MKKQKYILLEAEKTIELKEEDVKDFNFYEFSKNKFHSIYKDKTFNAEIIESGFNEKSYKIKIQNEVFDIKLKEPHEVELENLGFGGQTIKKISEIKAPMPGLVLDLFVEKEDELVIGDKILILEAMKMENIIKTNQNGKLAEILVKKGQAVEKGQILVKFY